MSGELTKLRRSIFIYLADFVQLLPTTDFVDKSFRLEKYW